MKTIIVKNKYTGDKAAFDYSEQLAPREKGLAIKRKLSKCAYKLGCDISELEISTPTHEK